MVAARPGPLGQVGAGAQARRQQLPATGGQVRRVFVGGERLPDLLEGLAGPPGPQRHLHRQLRGFVGDADVREVAGYGVDLLLPGGGRLVVAAEHVEEGPGKVHEPVVRPGGPVVSGSISAAASAVRPGTTSPRLR